MRLVYAIEINLTTFSHDRVHIFELPQYGETNFYRSAISYDYFFNGMKQRNHNWKGNKMYHALFKRELDILKQYEETVALPQKMYYDIWDFYKGIDYNYKRKRYEPNSPTIS